MAPNVIPFLRCLAVVLVAVPAAALAQSIEDHDLRVNVEASLALNHSLAGEPIVVAVTGSRVALEGRVRTLHAKWEALETAASVRGVLEIDDRITIAAQAGRDAALEDEVRRRFDDIPKLGNARLEVVARDGVVKVSGRIRDARSRFTARDAVGAIPGVLGFVDAMTSPEAADDVVLAGVTELVGPRSLRRVPGLVEVEVTQGVVTLSGWVRRLSDRIESERTAWGVNGVRGVVNRLEIHPKPRAEDSLR